MKFRYDEEKRKFESAWEKTAKLYAEHGMTQSEIESMREFDWNAFKAERIWALHTQEIPTTENVDDESGIAESPMVKRYFERFTTEYDTYGTHSRYWWVQEITCEPVAIFLSSRSEIEIEMLTLYLFEGYTHLDIAKKIDRPRRSVTRYVTALVTEIRRLYLENLPKSSFN